MAAEALKLPPLSNFLRASVLPPAGDDFFFSRAFLRRPGSVLS